MVREDPRVRSHAASVDAVLAEGLRPDLVWIVRDPDAVRASYVRRDTRPDVVEPRFGAAREQFDRWQWHMCRRDYEAIAKAVGLFDVERAGLATAEACYSAARTALAIMAP